MPGPGISGHVQSMVKKTYRLETKWDDVPEEFKAGFSKYTVSLTMDTDAIIYSIDDRVFGRLIITVLADKNTCNYLHRIKMLHANAFDIVPWEIIDSLFQFEYN